MHYEDGQSRPHDDEQSSQVPIFPPPSKISRLMSSLKNLKLNHVSSNLTDVSVCDTNHIPPNLAEVNINACNSKPSSLFAQVPQMVPGGFKNLTDIIVPPDVITLLSFGIKFVPPIYPSFSGYIKTLYDVQHLSTRLHKDPFIYLRSYLVKSYDLMLKTLNGEPTSHDKRISLMVQKTKQFLATHTNTCLLQSDKAKSIVLIYKSDYELKMETLISKNIQKGIYEEISHTETVQQHKDEWERQFRAISLKLCAECNEAKKSNSPLPFPFTLKRMLSQFHNTKLQLPYLYGSLKTHKDYVPCRPICSTR